MAWPTATKRETQKLQTKKNQQKLQTQCVLVYVFFLDDYQIMNNDYNRLIQEVKQYPLKKSYKSCIPCNVHIWDSGNEREITEIRDANPEVAINLVNDITARQFIKANFQTDVVDAFDTLMDESNRRDLALYCILYHNGGISMNSRTFLKNGFKLVALTEVEFFTQTTNLPAAPRCIMVTLDLISVLPKNEIMLSCIREIVQNTKLKVYGYNKHYPTGEGLLGLEYAKHRTDLPRIILKENRFVMGYYLVAVLLTERVRHSVLLPRRADISSWISKGMYRDSVLYCLHVNTMYCIRRRQLIFLTRSFVQSPIKSSHLLHQIIRFVSIQHFQITTSLSFDISIIS